MPRSVKTIHLCQSVGVSRSSLGSLLLGTHLVEFTGAQTGCTAATAEITLTACKPGQVRNLRKLDQSIFQFTCRDGLCVGMEVRCDQTPNCRDGSDERGCRSSQFCRPDVRVNV